MNYDKILEQLGEFGWWQRLNGIYLWLPAVVSGMNVMINSFTMLNSKEYRCAIPGCDEGEDFQFDDFDKNLLFPSLKNDSDGKVDYCSFYMPVKGENGTCSKTEFTNVTVECKAGARYTYAPFIMDNTVVTDNNMVCDDVKELWVPFVGMFFMIGLLIGSFVFGVLSDKIGRRHSLLLAVLTCCVGNLIGGWMPNEWSYALSRILAGAGGEGTFLLAFTMSMEYVGVKERIPCAPWVSFNTFLANMISIPFALGEIITVFFAMGLHGWKDFQFILSGVTFVACLVWIIIPESPRWLIANKKDDAAKAMMEKAAKINKVTLSPDLFEVEAPGKEEEAKSGVDPSQYGLKDLFHPSVRTITLCMFVSWPVITLLYYGLTFAADKLELTDNTYVNFILMALIEIPAYLILPLIIDVWGRKPVFVFTQIVPGVCCIAAAFLKSGVLYIILAMAGKFCAAAAFNTTFMFTAELYPTVIRNSAVGVCSTIARFGGAAAPFVAVYLPDLGLLPDWVPLTIFGVAGLLGGVCALLLPESLGSSLPDTFEDLEEIKRTSKPIWKCQAA